MHARNESCNCFEVDWRILIRFSFSLSLEINRKTNLRSKKNGILVEEEGEMIAGDVKASCQPFSRRNVENGSTLWFKLAEIIDGILESLCIWRCSITNPSKICQGSTMFSAVYAGILEIIFPVVNFSAINISWTRQNHSSKDENYVDNLSKHQEDQLFWRAI